MTAFTAFLLERRAELWLRLGEHVALTGVSVGLACAIGLPLAVLARRRPRLEGLILGGAGVLQTVPSLALLSLLMVALASLGLRSLGAVPALIALTLYALLPVVQNALTGLRSVPADALEAAQGLGMTDGQRLRLVELPLALPVIVAGVRTATVIGVGVTTLAAFIGAGGLGEFINRGLYLSQRGLLLLGAVPAAGLALALDRALAWAEAALERGPGAAASGARARRAALAVWLPALAAAAWLAAAHDGKPAKGGVAVPLRAAFTGEFIERPDGLPGLEKTYGLRFADVRDMEESLMYQALDSGAVDVISAYSTDGRLDAYHVRLLEDDRRFFPPYEAAPVAREAALSRVPELGPTLDLLGGKLDAAAMRRLNYEVDQRKRNPEDVAREFLASRGLLGRRSPSASGPRVTIGTKAFTEGMLLGHVMALLLETRLGARVERRFNLGGTMIVHNALKAGDIDVYAEYTGTALTAILGLPPEADAHAAYARVDAEYRKRFGCRWLAPLGFNNTYALGVREALARERGWTTIDDLKR